MYRFLIIALTLTFALPAQAFVFGIRLDVTELKNGDFRVEFYSGAAETEYWCAAGLHVTNHLGLDGRTRVFRVSPEPRKRGKGIDFTLDPARSSGTTGITTFGGKQDGGMSANVARNFCYDFEIDSFGRGR